MVKKSPMMIGCLGLIGIVILISLFHKSDPRHDSELEAWTMCEQFVKESLKAPKTAEFSSVGETTHTLTSKGSFLVKGWVEAKNVFGVPLRNGYTCEVRPAGHERWTLERLDFSRR